MSDLYAVIGIAVAFFSSVVLAMIKAHKNGEQKEKLKASQRKLADKAKQDEERNEKIKLLAENELRSRDQLFGRMRTKPDQNGK